MIIFIDESGDSGFKIHRGSSPIFVIALVIFDDDLVAEETAVALKKLRRELQFPDTLEFKYHKSRKEIKSKFFKTCVKFNFRVRAIVIQKKNIYSDFIHTKNNSFFNYIVMQVLKNNKEGIRHAKLKFDSRGERKIRDELRTYLSKELDNKSNHIFSELKFVNSKQNILIQLADMIAGCIASYYKNKDKDLFRIIKRRLEDIWEFK